MIPLPDWRDRAKSFTHLGDRIAYWDEGSGEPLLLIHGYPSSSHDWHLVWEDLVKDYRVIACDMLGFGLSDKPNRPYSLHAQADLQYALLDHLGLGRTHALVHDYGVSVAQEMLARQTAGEVPARLDSVYFLNGGMVPGEHRPRLIQRIGAGPFGFVLGYVLNRKRFGESFSAVFGPDTQPKETELDTHWELITENGGNRIQHRLLGYMRDRMEHKARWVGALREADAPLGILNGAQDPVSGQHLFEAVLREVPDIDATSLTDIGHYPQLEAPERVLNAYRDFRRRS